MEAVEGKSPPTFGKIFGLFKLPFRNLPSTASQNRRDNGCGNNSKVRPQAEGSAGSSGSSVSSVSRSLLPTRHRLKLDPSNKLYFPYEPGKLVRSAIRIKNTSKSHVAFKDLQTDGQNTEMLPVRGFKWRLVIAYDGTRFSGWQYQQSTPTVQCIFEEALTQITTLGREELQLVGASQTDAGVHAWCQGVVVTGLVYWLQLCAVESKGPLFTASFTPFLRRHTSLRHSTMTNWKAFTEH